MTQQIITLFALTTLSVIVAYLCWRQYLKARRNLRILKHLRQWFREHPNADEIPDDIYNRIITHEDEN